MPKQLNGEEKVCLTDDAGTTGYSHVENLHINPYLTPNTKIKMDHRPKCKSYNCKT